MSQIQYVMKSKIGQLYLVASQDGLEGIFFQKQPGPVVKKLGLLKPEEIILSKAVKQLEEYFSGQRKKFELVLNPSGTSFQKQVWSALSAIPFGTTVSYSFIAQKIKNPKAVRAVGSANGQNPMCVIIPCQRVIAADGTIGGYSGGLAIKRQLLKLEGVSGF